MGGNTSQSQHPSGVDAFVTTLRELSDLSLIFEMLAPSPFGGFVDDFFCLLAWEDRVGVRQIRLTSLFDFH